jgi:phosphopantothenoylcysteine decarboxylase/phosphopantothenate--cysteine ligase
MAAAVADFRPAGPAEQKIKREGSIPEIRLEPAPDILASVTEYKTANGYPRIIVGFAAESQDLLANAQKKLARKRLDLIAANDISAPDAGFGVDTNRVILLDPNGRVDELPLLSKSEVARAILQRVVSLLEIP